MTIFSWERALTSGPMTKATSGMAIIMLTHMSQRRNVK